jgi:hypothetical protein
MKKITLFAAFAAATAFAGEWTGHISDSKCGAAHSDGSAKSIACVKGCVKGGMKPVFVTDGKVIKIANADMVKDDVLGKKVTVKGDLSGDTLTLTSVAEAK